MNAPRDVEKPGSARQPVQSLLLLAATLLAAPCLSGCLVAGYSSNGGAFIWPGGLGFVVVILVVLFLLRRRR